MPPIPTQTTRRLETPGCPAVSVGQRAFWFLSAEGRARHHLVLAHEQPADAQRLAAVERDAAAMRAKAGKLDAAGKSLTGSLLHYVAWRALNSSNLPKAAEALGVLEHNWVDIILSDLHMPEMDGTALVQALKKHQMWRNIPVVLITTEARPEVIKPFMNLGVQDYIQKPFRPETIRRKLTGILGEAHTPDASETESCDF